MNLKAFMELQIDLLTLRTRSFGEQMELVFAKRILKSKRHLAKLR